jgi:hypothetical protein
LFLLSLLFKENYIMKRSVLVVSLVMILSLLVSPLAVLAQDDEKDPAEFVSADELLTAAYPADWFVSESTDLPGFTVANSEKMLESVTNSEVNTVAASGDVSIEVLVLPAEVMGMMGLTVTEETTLEDLIGMLAEQMAPADTGTEDQTEVGEPEVIEVGEGDEALEIGKVSMVSQADKMDGYLVVAEIGDGIYLLAAAMVYTGELTEEVDATLTDILLSVEYAGTSEDLFNQMMGVGAEEAPVEDPTATPAK